MMEKNKANQIGQWMGFCPQIAQLSDIEAKYKRLIGLKQEIHNVWNSVLDACLPIIMKTDKCKFIRLSDDDKELNVAEVKKLVNLLSYHLPEVLEFEQDDAEKMAERERLLEKYNDKVYLFDLPKLEIRGGDVEPESIYYQRGLYRVWKGLKDTDEYKILRALQQNYKGSTDDLLVLYLLLLFYVSLSNEQADLEHLAKWDGKNLQETITNAPETAYNGLKKQNGVIVPPEPETAPDERFKLFLEYVPPKNKDKAVELLQRVMEAGYCNANYYWDASKWKNGKYRLALASFCYLASNYLDLSEKKNAKGDDTTNWQPFEILFDYDDKSNSKNQLMNTKKSFMRVWGNFNPPELEEIKTTIFDQL